MDSVYAHDAELFHSICEIVPHLSVRYLTSRDHCSDSRLEWVKGIFEQVEVYDLISQDTYAVSLARGRYDVLIVGVNDAGRIAKFGRSNGVALVRRMTFALMDQSDPACRARVLGAGFDDVFDLVRTSRDEAIIRIAAVCRRYRLAAAQEDLYRARSELIKVLTNHQKVSPQEVQILMVLYERIGNPVSYAKLTFAASRGNDIISRDNLKVQISNLRKKLESSLSIRSISGFGYMLDRTSINEQQ